MVQIQCLDLLVELVLGGLHCLLVVPQENIHNVVIIVGVEFVVWEEEVFVVLGQAVQLGVVVV